MNYVDLTLLILAIGVVGFLYSSVGHAGASGYIAVMALAGIAPAIIRPTALVLNIFVATIGGFQFWRAGYLSWRLFWPFALLSVPAAYLGGYWQLSGAVFRVLLGLILLFSAVHLIFRRSDPPDVAPPSTPAAIGVGAGIGLLSGLTGTGGGIFLTPLLLVCRWAHIRQAAAVSAVFILVNSIAGLGGLPDRQSRHPVADSRAGARRGHRRFPRLVFWEPALSASNHLSAPGHGSRDRGGQAFSDPVRG